VQNRNAAAAQNNALEDFILPLTRTEGIQALVETAIAYRPQLLYAIVLARDSTR
jgi:hypothetical protein